MATCDPSEHPPAVDSRSPRPLRAGIVGLGRKGRFHLECLTLTDALEVVAVCDEDPQRIEQAPPFGGRVHQQPGELLEQGGLDVVLITVGAERRTDLALQALGSGCHVVLEPPLAATSAEADRLLRAASHHRRKLIVAHPEHGDDEFREPLRIARSGQIGRLRAVAFTSWSYEAEDLLQPAGQSGDPLAGGDWLELLSTRLHQLLLLVDEQVESVFACAEWDERHSALTGLSVLIGFSASVSGRIDLRRRSVVPWQSGWVLDGTHGGYRTARHYTRNADGEIFFVPKRLSPPDAMRFYRELGRELADGPHREEDCALERHTVRLLEAVRESLAAQQSVRLTVDPLTVDRW